MSRYCWEKRYVSVRLLSKEKAARLPAEDSDSINDCACGPALLENDIQLGCLFQDDGSVNDIVAPGANPNTPRQTASFEAEAAHQEHNDG